MQKHYKITKQIDKIMETNFNIWEANRHNFLALLNNYSIDQLNKIPTGFHNNLIWNMGHIIVVQQSLVYQSSGLPTYVSADFMNRYKPGSAPTERIEKAEIDNIKDLLITLIEKTRTDYQNHRFSTYKKFALDSGFKIDNVEDAIAFNNYHEGMHFGYVMSIKKFV